MKNFSLKDIQGIQPIKSFFNEIQSGFLQDRAFDRNQVLSDAKKLNIDPADLLAGVMQPLLYEIGKLYEEGKIPAIQEQHFSKFMKELILEIRNEMNGDSVLREKGLIDDSVDVLLTVVRQNIHEFGISLLELHLKKAGFRVASLFPGLVPEELVARAKKMKAKIIGISISMVDQWNEVRLIADLFDREKEFHPKIIVGGYGIHENSPVIPGVIVFQGSIAELVDLVTVELATVKLATVDLATVNLGGAVHRVNASN